MTLWLYKQQSGVFSNINCCPSKWRRIVCVCVCVLDKAAIFKLDLDLENFPSKQLQGLLKIPRKLQESTATGGFFQNTS